MFARTKTAFIWLILQKCRILHRQKISTGGAEPDLFTLSKYSDLYNVQPFPIQHNDITQTGRGKYHTNAQINIGWHRLQRVMLSPDVELTAGPLAAFQSQRQKHNEKFKQSSPMLS